MPLIALLGITGGLGAGGPSTFDPNATLSATTRTVIVEAFDGTSHFSANVGVIGPRLFTDGQDVRFIMSKDNFSTNDTAANLIDSVSEILTTSDFSASTGWTTSGAGVTIGSGVCAFAGSADSESVTESSAVVTNSEWHLVKIVLSSYTSGAFRINIGGGAASSFFTPPSHGTYYLWMKSDTTGDSDFSIESDTTAGTGRFIGSITEVSLKTIPGNHMYVKANTLTRNKDSNDIWTLTGSGNSGLTTDAALTWDDDSWFVAAVTPATGSQDRFDAIMAMDGGDNWNLGNDQNGTFEPSFYNPGATKVWDNGGVTDTAFGIWEVLADQGNQEVTIYKGDAVVQAATATLFNYTASGEFHSLYSGNSGEQLAGDVYALYAYGDTDSGGGRQADLYDWIDAAVTGTPVDPTDPNDPVTFLALYEIWDSTSLVFGNTFKTIGPARTTDGETVGFVPDKAQFAANASSPYYDSFSDLYDAATESSEDPGFDNASVWFTSATGVSVATSAVAFSGVADAFISSDTGRILEADEWYIVEIIISAYTSGQFRIEVGGGTGADETTAYFTPSGTGTHYACVKSNLTTGIFTIRSNTTGNAFNGSISSMRVKAIPGNHMYNTTTANWPTRTTVNGVSGLTGAQDHLHTETNVTIPDEVGIIVAGTPDAGNWADYDSWCSIDGPDNLAFGQPNSEGGGQFHMGLNFPGVTEVWKDGVDTPSTWNLWELTVDWASTDAYEIWQGGVSAASGTLGTPGSLSGNCRLVMLAAGTGVQEVDTGDIFGLAFYDAGDTPRGTDLYNYFNTYADASPP